jgi:hypothetical protein
MKNGEMVGFFTVGVRFAIRPRHNGYSPGLNSSLACAREYRSLWSRLGIGNTENQLFYYSLFNPAIAGGFAGT